jgi:insulysin
MIESVINGDSNYDDDVKNILNEYDFVVEKNNVFRSINDKSDYKLVTLDNEMKIFFIKNEKTNVSCAHMVVDVGSVDNPKDLDGLAHFLEHMLFLGNEDTDNESNTFFQTEVKINGGMTNAYTDDTTTNYYFCVANDNFHNLMTMFHKFFVNPKFDVKYVEKEVYAVDSEHKKNKSNESWRTYNLFKKFVTDEINGRFATGNKESLLDKCGNPNVLRDRLIEFYNEHYSSHKMTLFISHNHIDDKFVKEMSELYGRVKLVKNVVNHPNNKIKLRRMKNAYELIKMKTEYVSHTMNLYWTLKGSHKFVNNLCVTSFNKLQTVLGSESTGSLYDLLVKYTCITSLLCGIESIYDKNCVVTIKLRLTDFGFDNWFIILYIVDAYIKNLIENDSMTDEIFDDVNKLDEKLAVMSLKCIEEMEGLKNIQMLTDIYSRYNVDLKYVIVCDILNANYDIRRKHFTKILKSMKMNRMKVIVSSNKFDVNELTEIDELYGTRYVKMNMDIIDDVFKHIHIKNMKPISNKYIDYLQNTDIIHPLPDEKKDYVLLENNGGQYYIKTKNVYDSYRFSCVFNIKLTEMNMADVYSYLSVLIYLRYIKKLHNEKFCMMNDVGFRIQMDIDSNNLSFNINYFPKNIELLLGDVLMLYFSFDKINKDIYTGIYDEIYGIILDNDGMEPYKLLRTKYIKLVNKNNAISNKDILEIIDNFSPDVLDYDEYILHVKKILSFGNIVGVFIGSIYYEQIVKIIDIVSSHIKPSTNRVSHTHNDYYEIDYEKIISKNVEINKNKLTDQNALIYGVFIDNIKPCVIKKNKDEQLISWKEKKPMIYLITMYLYDKFFEEIRTNRSLGYIADCSFINVNEMNNEDIFITFISQSSNDDIYNIVDEYVRKIVPIEINNITEEQFNITKKSIIKMYNEPFYNNDDEIYYVLGEIMSCKKTKKNRKFNNREKIAKAFEKCSLDVVKSYFTHAFMNNKRISLLLKQDNKNSQY